VLIAGVVGKLGHKRTTLRQMVESGRLIRTGRGVKGEPYKYALGEVNPAVSPQMDPREAATILDDTETSSGTPSEDKGTRNENPEDVPEAA